MLLYIWKYRYIYKYVLFGFPSFSSVYTNNCTILTTPGALSGTWLSRSLIRINTSRFECIDLLYLTFSYPNWYITFQMYQFWCISRSHIQIDTSRRKVIILTYLTFSYSNWYITCWMYRFWCISHSPIQLDISCLTCINPHVSHVLLFKLIHHDTNLSILMYLTFPCSKCYITP